MSLKSGVLALIVIAAGSPAMHAGTIIVPIAEDGTEGNANNTLPFDIAGFALSSERYQQIYAPLAFPAGPILITGIDFRPDAGLGSAFSATLPSIQIDLSTTSATVDALSTTFANNVGADDTVVFAMGPLSLSSADIGPAGGPKDFDIHIVFTTPFLYNRANGSLLLDVRNFGGGTTGIFDAEGSLTQDAISRVFTSGNQTVSSTTGTADSLGLVTQFDFVSATPEPATGILAVVGLLAVAALKSRIDR